MSTPQPGFQRARRPGHKELRAASILDAARRLGLAKGVRTVTLTDIAAEAGINKSAVLRYYETREEIFLRLAAEGWTHWAASVRAGLGASVERPLFCDLLTHATLNLEHHVSGDTVLSFKLVTLGALDDMARATGDFLPRLGEDRGRELVGAVAILVAGLWQSSHPSETLVALYEERPELGHAVVNLRAKLRSLTLALVRGLTERGTRNAPPTAVNMSCNEMKAAGEQLLARAQARTAYGTASTSVTCSSSSTGSCSSTSSSRHPRTARNGCSTSSSTDCALGLP